jgi:cytochrome c oxidase cbb3-type subunit 3
MPTKVEKDAVTGRETTGHEWDGIKELNTPLPTWWLYVFYATILFAAVWWLLYPSWPGLRGHFGGLLGADQRVELEERLAEARAARAQFYARIEAASLPEIRQDLDLLSLALAGGQAAFADNCAPCHALGGAGQAAYPTLADDDWLWGGTLEDIQQTVMFGVRSGHDEARLNEMPAFGEMLDPAAIEALTQQVLALSGQAHDAALAAEGAALFAEQCAACHGEGGTGMSELGGPNLTDRIWLYGGTAEQIKTQIRRPRHGVMPAWAGRLDPAMIKLLTVYVHSLGGGQ